MFSTLCTTFTVAWEGAYGEHYPFERKDGVAVAAMLKDHPEYGDAETWAGVCTRYLADEFWGRKRHPLVILATRAREFAGPAGSGLPAKVAASREATRNWTARGAR